MESVEFFLGSSRFFSLGFLLGFIGAGVVLVCLPILLVLKILGILGLIFYCRTILKLHLRRTAKAAVIRIWQDAKGRWGYQTRAGRAALGEIKGDSFNSSVYMILRFRFKTHHRSIFIPRDALSADEYRILSARLNFF